MRRPIAEDILDRDQGLRALQTRLQQAQARRNEASKLIGQAKAKKDEAQAAALMAEVAGLKDEIQKRRGERAQAEGRLDSILASYPKLPAADVPDGADENDNVEVKARAFGTRPTMNAAKEHFDLGEALGMMDFERAAKVSGARFVYLKAGSRASNARSAISCSTCTRTRSAIPKCVPPILARDHAFFGTGQLPKFENDQFWAISGELAWPTEARRMPQRAPSASIATASFQPPKSR